VHIIQITRRQTHVPMLRDSSIKSVVCKHWVVLGYFNFCDSFPCLPASMSIVMCSVSHCSFEDSYTSWDYWFLAVHFKLHETVSTVLVGTWVVLYTLHPLWFYLGYVLLVWSAKTGRFSGNFLKSYLMWTSRGGANAKLSGNVFLVSVLCS
jgi:hypothetical protein